MLTLLEGKQLAKEMFVLGTYEDFPTNTILELLKLADDLYFNEMEAIDLLEDDQYDALKQYAARMAPADVYFTGVGSSVRGGKVDLPYQMGSLNQAYLGGDFAKWRARHRIEVELLVLSNKLDGASAMYIYDVPGKLQIAYSRGDGIQGADITRHARKLHDVPDQIVNTTGAPIIVRAENIIKPSEFAVVNTGKYARGGRIYKNPRNMVSGLMNSSVLHDRMYDAIDTVAYEIVGSKLSKLQQLQRLKEYGFHVVTYETAVAGDLEEDDLTEILNRVRKDSEYELDGIVIDIDSAAIRAKLTTTELNPEYSQKYKVADASNYAEAKCTNVEWNISKDGYYKPRVQIEPTVLVGVTITNLTGFNAKFIKENMIGPGAVLKITRSGDVIPFILGVVTPAAEPMMPDDEDAVWSETDVDLIVADVSNNETVKFERLVDFFSSIDVPHLGEGNLREMFDMGFDTPEKIIPLAVDDVSNLVRSKSIGSKIHAGLRAKFTNIALYDLMGSHHAFGRGVGKRKMKKLYEAWEGQMHHCESISKITDVEGFEEKTARKIQAGYSDFLEFMRQIKGHVTIAPYVAKTVGKLTGKTFVFTGFRSAELEKQIVDAGGAMGSTVSKNTTYLVTAEANSTSTKAKKARDIGVTVIGQEELKAML